jgi:predicted ATPase
MPNSSEIRRLSAKWSSGTGWPKRLESLRISGLRGWTGQQFKLGYPIMAVVGENGSGKSTVIQCAAAVYRSTAPKTFYKGRGYASDYFPKTYWDKILGAEIGYTIRTGERQFTDTIRRPGTKWRGNMTRQDRPIVYIDLSRIQPVPARTGYWRIAKSPHKELSAQMFDKSRLERFSQIMGRDYDLTKMAITDIDKTREVPVLGYHAKVYSGFHTGAGETMIAELLKADMPKYSLVLIDEVETSLHPRAQRRLIRDLAERCRELELQIVLTTHSPFILDELPHEARAHILETSAGRTIVYGVSPEFSMTKMDDVPQYECDIYVEDKRSQILLTEILVAQARPELILSCRVIMCGLASVGQALGIMVHQRRFPRPSCVFLDGDQAESTGCVNLPGEDAPERVVFEALKQRNWLNVGQRVGRNRAELSDACSAAMLLQNHHDWINHAAATLVLGGDILWQAFCAEWATNCLTQESSKKITQTVEDALIGIPLKVVPKRPIAVDLSTSPTDSTGNALLFEL